MHNLIRKDNKVVYGDAGYLGIEKRKDDESLKEKEYKICKRHGIVKQMNGDPDLSEERKQEYQK